MSSIDFFTPITYDTQPKTISQKALEVIDECFYLGGKFRVKILSSDAEHPVVSGMEDRQNCYRSWANIAIKVASYCTLILPLIGISIKAALRLYLKVSAIQFQPTNDSDQKQSNLIAVTPDSLESAPQQPLPNPMNPFATEIQKFSEEPMTPEVFQQLLIGLVTADHSECWDSDINRLMSHWKAGATADSFIKSQADLAELLATSSQPISPNQIYKFCKYLGNNLPENRVWLVYLALDQYLLKPQLDSGSITKAIKEYLTQQTNDHIKPCVKTIFCQDEKILKYQNIDIDPKKWFGSDEETSSLWQQPRAEGCETPLIPKLLLEALENRILSLSDSFIDYPCKVNITGRLDVHLPYNFTLPLAKIVTDLEIFFEHHDTIDEQQLNQSNYAKKIFILSNDEKTELVQSYKSAVIPMADWEKTN